MATLQLFTHANYGDDLLSQATRYAFEAFSGEPAGPKGRLFRWEAGFDSRYTVTPTIVSAMNRHDLQLIPGGGLFIPRNEDISGWAVRIARQQLSQLHSVIVFSVGYNTYPNLDSFGPVFKDNLDALMDRTFFLGCRDLGTLDALSSLVTPRVAKKLFFQPCPTTILDHLVDTGEVKTPEAGDTARQVCFNIQPRAGIDNEQYFSQVLAAMAHLRSMGYVPVLATLFDRTDRAFVDYCLEKDFAAPVVTIHHEGSDPLIGPKVFQHMPIVVAARGHSAMVAWGAASLVIPIDTSVKMEYFTDQYLRRVVGYPDTLLRPDDPDLAQAIVRAVKVLDEGKAALREETARTRQEYALITLDNLSRIYHHSTGRVPRTPSFARLSEYEAFLIAKWHHAQTLLEGKTRLKP